MTENPPSPRRGAARPPSPVPTELTVPPAPETLGTGILLSPAWLRERGLPEGGPLDLEGLPDGSVLLRSVPAEPPQRAVRVIVTPGRPSEHLFRELVAAYLGGATEIEISEVGGPRPETRQILSTFAERIGAQRPPTGADLALGLSGPEGEPPDAIAAILRRMYESVHELQEQAGHLLDARGAADARGIERKDDDIDRWAWQIERRAAGAHGADPGEIVGSVLIARALERIGDHAVVLGEHAARLSECAVPAPVRATLKACHRQALDYLASAFAATERPDRDRANELLDTGAALHAAHRSLTEGLLVRGPTAELSPLASVDLGLILQSIDRTIAYAEDLAEVGLDRAVAARPTPRSGSDGLPRRRRAPKVSRSVLAR